MKKSILPKIQDIQCFDIYIPFKHTFSHAGHRRTETETILVKIVDQNGNTGYGEGCPRSYVTKETIESAVQFIEQQASVFTGNFITINKLMVHAKTYKQQIDQNPSAWAAFETACLDLIAKARPCSIESLFNLQTATLPELTYSAVIGSDSFSFKQRLDEYVSMAFEQYKIKLSGHSSQDRSSIQEVLRKGIEPANIRFDANNLWRSSDEVIAYFNQLAFKPAYLEEPVAAGDFHALERIHDMLGCKIILDESFLRMDDFKYITSTPDKWAINLRISKMGGILRTLEIAHYASERSIAMVIGSHVGETSLLTRAATLIATAYKNHIVAMEGAFSDYLLEYDLFSPKMQFSHGGVLKLGTPLGDGMGLTFQPDNHNQAVEQTLVGQGQSITN